MTKYKKISFQDSYTNTEKPTIDIKKAIEFEPSRLTFNFSFITRDRKYNFSSKGCNKNVKNNILDKIVRLSSESFVSILGWPREQGIERMPESDVGISINPEFISSKRHASCLEDLWVFRLSKHGRIIGKIQDKTFYVLAIDTTFDAYKH